MFFILFNISNKTINNNILLFSFLFWNVMRLLAQINDAKLGVHNYPLYRESQCGAQQRSRRYFILVVKVYDDPM